MLPIIGQAVEAYKLSIYNRAGHPKHPFNGARLKNTTPLHVMQGPVTVFDAEAYAGDARLDDLAPGQDRLISYALDLKIEVEPKTGAGQEELLSVAVRKGTLTATRKLRETTVYQIRNRDRQNKILLIEHPYRSDWRLSEPTKPTERTRDVYRFAVQTEAGKSGELTVVEEKQIQQTVHLLESSSDMIAYYLQAKQVSPAVREALQRVIALRDRLSQTTNRRDGLEQRVREIGQEQNRIRENMARLPQNADLYNRYVKKLDQQETEIDQLRKEAASLKTAEQEQKRELNDYLLSLDLG
jgi:predicted nuclease with TOPRIM domain